MPCQNANITFIKIPGSTPGCQQASSRTAGLPQLSREPQPKPPSLPGFNRPHRLRPRSLDRAACWASSRGRASPAAASCFPSVSSAAPASRLRCRFRDRAVVAGGPSVRNRRSKRAGARMPLGLKPTCSVCRTTSSSMWKKGGQGEILCNNCTGRSGPAAAGVASYASTSAASQHSNGGGGGGGGGNSGGGKQVRC